MLAPYRSILVLPGALAFSASGLLARMEVAMVGLGSLLLVQRETGSYGLGGAVAGAIGISGAAVSPLVAALIDRVGQARVLRPAIALHVLALGALVLAASLHAPLPVVFAAAIAAGAAQVSVGALVRARWAVLLGGTPRLQTAFALESVLDEVVFVVGPILVTLLATLVHPAAGLLLAALTAVTGVLLLAGQHRTQPPHAGRAEAGAPRTTGSALRVRGMLVVVLVFFMTGGVFGSAEVAVVAATRAAGAPAAAGLVLALWATGSMLSGVVYGSVLWRGRIDRRFVLLVVLLNLTSSTFRWLHACVAC